MKFERHKVIDFLSNDNDGDLYPGYSHEIIDDDNYLFQSKEYLDSYVDEIIEIFDSFPKEFPIYRSIYVKSEENINWDNLGESWSFDFESAKQFGRHNGSNIILSAFVNENNVDWVETLRRYLIFSGNQEEDDEHEIVVIDTDELKDIKATPFKEAKEIGENPIFTRVPNVKSFESFNNERYVKDNTGNEIFYRGNRFGKKHIFDKSLIGKQSLMKSYGFSFSSNRNIAMMYAKHNPENVSEFKIKNGNFLRIDAYGRIWKSIKTMKHLIGDGSLKLRSIQDWEQYAMEQGYEGLIVDNILEALPDYSKNEETIGTTIIVFDADKIEEINNEKHNIIYTNMRYMKSFEEVLFEPTHIKRFSEISMSKGEIKNKFGDLIKQLQELVLHLFDKNQTPEINCKITTVHNDENDEWVDGIELPDGEFSKLNLTDLSELFKEKKKILPCKMKFTDDKGKRTKEPIINGYIKFYHPKLDKQNEPDMPWESELPRY